VLINKFMNIKYKFKEISKDQRGISLILSVIIIVSLLGIVVSVSNITRRVAQDNILIEASEIAFLVADSAAEVALYEIIKNGQGVSLPDLQNQNFAINGATWDRNIEVALTIPARCNALDPKPVCTDSSDSVSATNPLHILVADNNSFQFDFDIVGANYPVGVDLTGDILSQTEVTVVANGVQTKSLPGSQLVLSGLSGNSTRVRLTNTSGGEGSFTLTPQGIEGLPVGINISTIGEYLGVERRIEVTKPAWLTYR